MKTTSHLRPVEDLVDLRAAEKIPVADMKADAAKRLEASSEMLRELEAKADAPKPAPTPNSSVQAQESAPSQRLARMEMQLARGVKSRAREMGGARGQAKAARADSVLSAAVETVDQAQQQTRKSLAASVSSHAVASAPTPFERKDPFATLKAGPRRRLGMKPAEQRPELSRALDQLRVREELYQRRLMRMVRKLNSYQKDGVDVARVETTGRLPQAVANANRPYSGEARQKQMQAQNSGLRPRL